MTITEQDMAAAYGAWANALVALSKTYEAEGIDAARALAGEAIDALYAYGDGPVLFKPTLASGDQTFRPTRDGALAYFVGHDDVYTRDQGFGILGWRNAEFHTKATFTQGDVAIWMGRVEFTDKDGKVIEADKSFGYKRDAAGDLRIVLHHSSLPYQP
ncbi:hypothetical protein TRM7557_00392 [Tritonibacter multivorans]|uniref:Phosphoribosyl-AMP cyclohydrolase n=1 Tax=Tritonibacter multivorans TaxID=928856 RepID=A0A0P1G111_9RHOB|nr:hypothetical protein [Tritonibacter multivorans]MDA7419431.1 phosphoribosyl-AMP cyclohydrolase [Tritonibacter multivorans]CUH75448.1 hypothetical protein TRM7557_00392 [Tritonibacter multivorans]SFC67463.1 hypothetical protein SAMN04488049_103392 [Tritonibacter multivorans]